MHVLNPALIRPARDPFKPRSPVCAPDRAGRPRLVAAQWFMPLATGITGRPPIVAHR